MEAEKRLADWATDVADAVRTNHWTGRNCPMEQTSHPRQGKGNYCNMAAAMHGRCNTFGPPHESIIMPANKVALPCFLEPWHASNAPVSDQCPHGPFTFTTAEGRCEWQSMQYTEVCTSSPVISMLTSACAGGCELA